MVTLRYTAARAHSLLIILARMPMDNWSGLNE